MRISSQVSSNVGIFAIQNDKYEITCFVSSQLLRSRTLKPLQSVEYVDLSNLGLGTRKAQHVVSLFCALAEHTPVSLILCSFPRKTGIMSKGADGYFAGKQDRNGSGPELLSRAVEN